MTSIALLLTTVVTAVGGTHGTVAKCDTFKSHIRCSGSVDALWRDDDFSSCRFIARMYPHGQRSGDANNFTDIRIDRCKSMSKQRMVDRQMGAQRRV